jgi:tetratricopeptide (TPR) repeat protein
MLLGSDPGRENRQVGIVDARGGASSFTGSRCLTWAGDTTAAGLAVQGNILAGPEVVSEMMRAYATADGELAERLLAALHAAQAAGGDRRGQQSAALLVVRPSNDHPEYRTRYIELRIEDHPTPIDELERVFRIHQASDLLRAHLRYAALFDSLGNEDGANRERHRVGQALERILAMKDADAGTLNALAWFCATAGMHLEESLEAARRAVDQEPENTGILDTLAEVLFRLGRKKEALATIERALAIEPEDSYLQDQRDRFLGKTPR